MRTEFAMVAGAEVPPQNLENSRRRTQALSDNGILPDSVSCSEAAGGDSKSNRFASFSCLHTLKQSITTVWYGALPICSCRRLRIRQQSTGSRRRADSVFVAGRATFMPPIVDNYPQKNKNGPPGIRTRTPGMGWVFETHAAAFTPAGPKSSPFNWQPWAVESGGSRGCFSEVAQWGGRKAAPSRFPALGTGRLRFADIRLQAPQQGCGAFETC